MVPAAVVVLPELPLTTSGKLDRAALPAPDYTGVGDGLVEPVTETERVLCDLMAGLLGLDRVGTNQSFFDLGGDSIVAIQLVSRAQAAGVAITTRDVFIHQTPAGLARIAGDAARRPAVEHDAGEGEVGPMPIMERLRHLGADVRRFSHSALVAVPAMADGGALATALDAVTQHHAILRARLVVRPDGRWSLLVPPRGEAPVERPRRVVATGPDGAILADDQLRALVTAETEAAAGRLDPYAGVLVQAVWFDAGPAAPGRLLLVVHHLAIDGVSWRILLPDLASAWQAASAGQAIALPPVGTSPRRWAELLAAEAASSTRTAELASWRALLRDTPALVRAAHSPNGPADWLTVALPAAITEPLLTTVPATFAAGVQDVLLAAFGIALADWQRGHRGQDGTLAVDVEGHGRIEELAAGVDLTRSIGWFTSIAPLRLEPGALSWSEVGAAGVELRDAVVRLVGQVRAAPGDGLGWGLLRYLGAATELAELPEPQIAFNYLGRFGAGGTQALWEPIASAAADRAGAGPLLPHPLELNAVAYDDGDGARLVADWTWARGLLAEQDVRALAERWFAVLAALVTCAARPGMRVAPAPARTDAIPVAERGEHLPLSFAQLENVYQPVGPESAHHNVISATVLDGDLDEDALRYSLDRIVARHEVLRTGVRRSGTGWVQVIDPAGRWPLATLDLREFDAAERDERLRQAIRYEEKEPLPLATGPMVRGTLITMAPRQYVLLLVLHHIVIDPWGYTQLESELRELYDARLTGREPKLPEIGIQVADIAVWEQQLLASGALDQNLAYWRRLLRDLPGQARFEAVESQLTEVAEGYTHGVVFDEEFTRLLKETARRCGVTLFMLLLSAYHALLATYTHGDDIAVSFPVAGRERPEATHLVAYFINMVVVRADLAQVSTFLDLTAQVRDGTLAAHAHQHLPLRSLDGGITAGWDPFRIMFNLVNYPDITLDLPGLHATALVTDEADDVVIPRMVTAMEPYNLDLYLIMHENEGRLGGLWLYHPDKVDSRVMAAMMRRWRVLLELVIRDPGIPLARLRELVGEYGAAGSGAAAGTATAAGTGPAAAAGEGAK